MGGVLEPLEDESLPRRIRDYCSRLEDHRRCEKDTHHVTLSSIKEYKVRQQQQKSQKERDEVYKGMSWNLERVREVAWDTLSRASTISAEECWMALTETDFINIKEKMNKIDQRIDGLYQNWQAEYKEVITTEQCEEIQQFYEPYVMKYETKYKILYQILRQASQEHTRAPSSRVPLMGMTHSLAALDDASALKQKEWSRGEPGEDTPQMYSTIDGHLTPTAPVYEDMRTETPLNVTTEESHEGLPAAVGGMEERENTQQTNDEDRDPLSDVAPPAADAPETSFKEINERSLQEDSSWRNEITRETSREEALATARHFFNIVNERRNIPEVLATSATGVSQTDTPSVSHDPVETEPAEPVTISPWTYLPNGSPPRPTATATCRPQTWVQCISEGQIDEHSREDEDSLESEPLEPLVLQGLPDELGPEWRVLHPFEIPGVRFPMDDTPPTHRRLVENDALIELIQTAEYLEDAPSWGQRRFHPPQYGDHFYWGQGRGHGRGRGRERSWLSEDTTERDSGGGQGRNIGHGNGRDRETFPRTIENDRRDGDWPVPNHVDWRYINKTGISRAPCSFAFEIFWLE